MPANHCVPHTEESKLKMSLSHKGVPLPQNRRPSKIVNGIEVFRCGRCFEFLPIAGFYKNKRTILGITSECKKCHVRTSINSRNKDNSRRINRESMERRRIADPEKFREMERISARKRIVNQRTKARIILNSAVNSGRIKKPNKCSLCCAERKLNAHHEDYSEPLVVEWLCTICHGKKHRHG